MSESEIKSLYDSLIKSGDLLDVYPDMTGDWKKDKGKFEKEYEANQRMLDLDNEDLYEDEEDQLYP